MAEIPKLNVFENGDLADVVPLNENFEMLRVALNENTSGVASGVFYEVIGEITLDLPILEKIDGARYVIIE